MKIFALIGSSFSVFVLFLLVHVIPFRIKKIHKRVRALTITMLFCSPLLVPAFRYLSGFSLSGDTLVPLLMMIYVLLVFTLIWFGYLLFYFAFERSPSLRYLVHSGRLGERNITLQSLEKVYDFNEVYIQRVRQMAEAGLLVTTVGDDGVIRYSNSPRGQAIGFTNLLLKDFFNLGTGG